MKKERATFTGDDGYKATIAEETAGILYRPPSKVRE
jgi:hypothetical protein